MATSKTSSRASAPKSTSVSAHKHTDLESRIAALEAAVAKNQAGLLECVKQATAMAEGLSQPQPSQSGQDPRVDNLIGKLRQLVTRLQRNRGNIPDWPTF